VTSGSARKVRRKFWHKVQDFTVLHEENIHRIVTKLR
jgi:hypothetical protein